MDRNPIELIISIVINWLIGLLPAVILRYAVFRKPVKKKTAIILSAIIFLLLTVFVTWLASLAEIQPNMAPVAIWTILTYFILHRGYKEDSNNDANAGKERGKGN